jgi:hypothetical protein
VVSWGESEEFPDERKEKERGPDAEENFGGDVE